MIDDLTVTEPERVIGNLLPYNYLPAAFQAIAAKDTIPDMPGRIVFVLPDDAINARTGLDYHVVSAKTLAVPSDLSDFLVTRNFSDADSFRRCFLGPPTSLQETPFDAPWSLNFEKLELATTETFDRAAVLIDIGIAFWNARFRVGNASRFKAMRYLNFDAVGAGLPPFAGLSEGDIATYCGMTKDPGGSERIVEDLGKRFPGSCFDTGGNAFRDALWHGTAMADLMAGLPTDSPDRTALFGIDLPMAVLRDSDGDSLTWVLTLLIEAALQMTSRFDTKPLVIVLPWAFSAGPQDGSHPAAMAIQTVLAAHPGRVITVMVSAGNQLQDRCCAHLKQSETPLSETVIWQLPPDDFSDNTAEFIVTPAGPPASWGIQTVRITTPGGQSFVIAIRESHRVWFLRNGQIIGALLRYRDSATGPRLRLTFGPTGWKIPAHHPTPAGDWHLSFGRTDTVSLWVLRDDRDRKLDGPLPRRTSVFYDADYRERGPLGDYQLADDPESAVVRSGTASVLGTGKIKPTGVNAQQAPVFAASLIAVQANELMIGVPERQAGYSGRRMDGQPVTTTEIVDRDRYTRGVSAVANGSPQRVNVSGTSAAVALSARAALGYPVFDL